MTQRNKLSHLLGSGLCVASLLFLGTADAQLRPKQDAKMNAEDIKRNANEKTGMAGNKNNANKGVTLYADAEFLGTSEMFRDSVSFLGDTTIGNDNVSSVRVSSGCTVRFFDDVDYRGNSVIIDRDVSYLGDTDVGNDRASSIEVNCGGDGPKLGPGETDGVTLYHDANFQGGSVTLYDDVSFLGDIEINNDSVSSMRVGKGCEARLFQDAEFRGDSFKYTKDVSYLGDTPIGNDNASSIEVACR